MKELRCMMWYHCSIKQCIFKADTATVDYSDDHNLTIWAVAGWSAWNRPINEAKAEISSLQYEMMHCTSQHWCCFPMLEAVKVWSLMLKIGGLITKLTNPLKSKNQCAACWRTEKATEYNPIMTITWVCFSPNTMKKWNVIVWKQLWSYCRINRAYLCSNLLRGEMIPLTL